MVSGMDSLAKYIGNGVIKEHMDHISVSLWKLNEVVDYYSRETFASSEWSLKSEIFVELLNGFSVEMLFSLHQFMENWWICISMDRIGAYVYTPANEI